MKLYIFICFFALAFSGSLIAKDRALIIGLTQYKNSELNLPGIDLDVRMAEKMAKMLGFESSSIKTLTGKNASRSDIEQTFQNWLIKGTSADDRVLFYFSGHGGRIKDKNGDEKDGQDEYITAYDLGRKVSEGGFILDDDLSKWINSIPSQNKLIILDSCHSGTASREIKIRGKSMGENTLFSKKHSFTDSDSGNFENNYSTYESDNIDFLDGKKNILTLAAAHDYEPAKASQKGSLFTLGLYQALSADSQKGTQSSTARQLVGSAARFIEQTLAKDPDSVHSPVISGDASLLNKPLLIKAARNSQGNNWQDLLALSDKGEALNPRSNQSQYKTDDIINFTVDLPQSGYLNIINVDAHDEVLVLFPNKYNRDNKVRSGSLKIPDDLMDFELYAKAPYGDSLTLFILTSKPLNLYEDAMDVRDIEGNFSKDFAKMDEGNYRSIGLRAKSKQDKLYTGSVKTTVR